MKINKLKAILITNNESFSDLASYLKISKATIYKKLKQKNTDFTRDEIEKIKMKYKLTAVEVDDIFFEE